MTKIMDMRSFMSDVNTTFIVLEKLQINQGGGTTQYLVADETACIHLHIWEGDFMKMTAVASSPSDTSTTVGTTTTTTTSGGGGGIGGDKSGGAGVISSGSAPPKKGVESSMLLNPGDICRIIGGKCTVFKSSLGLYIGKGTLERISDFCMIFNESKNMSQIEFNASVANAAVASQQQPR